MKKKKQNKKRLKRSQKVWVIDNPTLSIIEKAHKSIYNQAYYEKNKVKRKKEIYGRRKKLKNFVNSLKLGTKCRDCTVKCTKKYLEKFEFHHKNRKIKKFSISDGVVRGYSLKRIKKEIKKCVLLCTDCHNKINPTRFYDKS